MHEFQKKQGLRKRMYSTPVLLILFIVTILSFRGAYTMMVKERVSLAQTNKLSAEYANLKIREGELSLEFERLKTMSGIEEEIKSKFNVAKAGEMVAVIVDNEDEGSTTTPKKLPWWKRFLGGIIGK